MGGKSMDEKEINEIISKQNAMDINALKQMFAEKIMEAVEQYGGDVSIYRNGNFSPDEIMQALNGKMVEISRIQAQEIEEERRNRPVAEVKYDIMEVIDRINREVPPKPMIRFTPILADKTDIFDSKLGGVPYLPKNFPYPVGRERAYKDIPLKLLIQLNFERLPHIENFPEKGILQIFCACDNDERVYGLDFDDSTNQNGFRVIYHENIITDRSQLIDDSDLPAFDFDGCNFPFDGEFLLQTEEPKECSVTRDDISFMDRLMKYCGEISGKELKSFADIEQAGFGKLDFLWDNYGNECSCIGGYPFYTQFDPRCTDELSCFDTLLIQINSYYDRESQAEIMWGDMGVANFFIPEENLKNCDFSEVLYNWDCS